MTKFSVLTTIDYPFLGHFLASLVNWDIEPTTVVCDKKGMSKGARSIILDRLYKNFVPIDISRYEGAASFVYFGNHNEPKLVDYHKTNSVNLLVNFGSPRILGPNILGAFDGVLGVHPGLIPRFRGCTNVEWAILEDEKIGNTVFFLTEELDRGPIVLAESLEFRKTDDYRAVRTKVYLSGIDLLARGLKKVIDNRIVRDALPFPGKGIYYKPIDVAKMTTVIEKVDNGAYKYQL